jgi:hypothetical protein
MCHALMRGEAGILCTRMTSEMTSLLPSHVVPSYPLLWHTHTQQGSADPEGLICVC